MNFTESLFEQFDAVRTETLQRSHVNMYGDYRLGSLQFGKFNLNTGKKQSEFIRKGEHLKVSI